MSKRTRRTFTIEQKSQAVEQYLSGEKTASKIAEELKIDVQTIYRWKTSLEEKRKDSRVQELIDEGKSFESAELLAEKEFEIELYQKKIAQQSIIIDLLKKSQSQEVSVRESELSGLIRITRQSAQKRKRAKR